jgi:uncharacterized protein (TIGR02147 family)
MKDSIFDYRDYKKYLRDFISSQPSKGRGLKSGIANAVQCQTAYVSQVLNGHAHFSLEQADKINKLFSHSKDEAKFFILLVEHQRAGTASLREYFQHEIEIELQKRLVIKNRVQSQKNLTLQEQAIYYSAWYYVAIYVAISLPTFQDKQILSKYFGLSMTKVTEILDFLETTGLIKHEKGKYTIGTTQLHLATGSPFSPQHHSHWRHQAIRSLNRDQGLDLHYSTVVTISDEDVIKIKSILVKTIENTDQIVRDSKESSIHCLAMDFFRL